MQYTINSLMKKHKGSCRKKHQVLVINKTETATFPSVNVRQGYKMALYLRFVKARRQAAGGGGQGNMAISVLFEKS